LKTKRSKIGLLIAGIVLVGVGSVVVGNWTTIRLQYHLKNLTFANRPLKGISDDERWQMERNHVSALFDMGDSAVPHLLRILGSREETLGARESAGKILARIGGDRACEGVYRIFKEAADEEIRLDSNRVLSKIFLRVMRRNHQNLVSKIDRLLWAPNEFISELVDSLDSESETTRYRAAVWLKRKAVAKGPYTPEIRTKIVAILIKALDNSDFGIRKAAARAVRLRVNFSIPSYSPEIRDKISAIMEEAENKQRQTQTTDGD